MNANEIKLRVLASVGTGHDETLACDDVCLGFPGSGRAGDFDLLVIDARTMAAATLKRALRQVAEWHAAGTFRHAVLIWPQPELAGVVLALRSGVAEVVPGALSLLQGARILARVLGSPALGRASLRRLALLLRVGRAAAQAGHRTPEQERALSLADAQRAHFDRQLAEREAALAQREQELRATATRVQADLARANQACAMIELAAEMRSELEARENELRVMARELAPPAPLEVSRRDTGAASAPGAEVGNLLQTQQLSLDRRERALATRERWLRDYEQALTGRAVGSPSN